MITKKEYSASDAAPSILYAKRDGSTNIAHPITQGMFNPGFAIPDYDEIDLEYTGDDLTQVEYKKQGDVIATLTLSYTGGNLTKVAKT